jgi:hypothetical protein
VWWRKGEVSGFCEGISGGVGGGGVVGVGMVEEGLESSWVYWGLVGATWSGEFGGRTGREMRCEVPRSLCCRGCAALKLGRKERRCERVVEDRYS